MQRVLGEAAADHGRAPWLLASVGLTLSVAAWTVQIYDDARRVDFLAGVAIAVFLAGIAVLVGPATRWVRVLACGFGALVMLSGALTLGFLTWIGGLTIVIVAVFVDRGPLTRPPKAASALVVVLAIAVVVYAATLPGEAKPMTFAFPKLMSEADQRAFEQLLIDHQDVMDGYHRLRDDGFCVVWDIHATDEEIADAEQAWAALGIEPADVPGCSL